MTRHLAPAALLLLLAAVAGGAQSKTLKRVTAEPAAAPGQPITITPEFDLSKGLNCNVRFHFGDGETQDAKVNQENDAKLPFAHG